MRLKKLQDKINHLKQRVEFLPEAVSLYTKVALNYNRRTLKELNIIINIKPSISQTPADILKRYLSQHWELINGNLLSYTCMPNAELTQLMCDIARYVAEEENKKGCYVLSMPFEPRQLSEIPLHDYNSACIRIKELETDKVCWLQLNPPLSDCSLVEMGDFNEGYIHSQNQLFYINKLKKQLIRLIISSTQLAGLDENLGHPEALMALSEQQLESLRALPGHPPKFNGLYYVNKQKNQLIALDVTEKQLNEFDQTILDKSKYNVLPLESVPDCCGNLSHIISPCSVIKLLMPTVSIVSFSNDYEDLDSDTSILNTHILGEDGTYLIPIKLVTQLNLAAEAPLLPNPYYDYTIHPERARYFNPSEGNEHGRLTAHSDLTRAVFETKAAYEELANDKNNLLGQLRLLCQQLHLNAVHHLGVEQHAGGGAYPAIIRSIEYYQQLKNDEIQKIPTGLHQEFRRIFSLVTDTTQNINHTADTRTCIATFRANLLREMSGHEKLLSTIALSGVQNELLIETAKNHFEDARTALSESLQRNSYLYGQDSLELNNELLFDLNIRLYNLFRTDQNILKSLSPNELRSLCTSPSLQQEIAIQLSNVDELVIFMLDMSPEQLMAFLQSNHDSLWISCIRSPQDLRALLISKDIETCQVICTAWQNNIISMLTTEWAYHQAKKNLSPQQGRILDETIKDRLFELLWGLRRILVHLDPDDRITLYRSVQTKLYNNLTQASTSTAQKANELRALLCVFPLSQRNEIYQAVEAHVPGLIASGDDFGHSADEFRAALEYLSPPQRSEFYSVVKSRLNRMIESCDDFKNVLEFLTPEERSELYRQTKSKLPQLIKVTYKETRSANDVFSALQYLNTAQIDEILSYIIKRYSNLILEYFLNDLSLEFKPVVFHFLQNQSASGINLLKRHIHSISDIHNILTPLSPKQRQFMFHKIKDKLPELIDVNKYKLTGRLRLNISSVADNLSAKHYNKICSLCATEEREELYHLMRTQLPEFILDSFIIEHLEIKHGTNTTAGMVTRDLLKNLSPMQCKEVCQQVIPTMLLFIEPNIIHFYSILQGLPIEHSTAVTEAMERALHQMIKSLDDCSNLFQHIELAQREAVYEILKDELTMVIKSQEQCDQIKQWLIPTQQTDLSHRVTLHQLGNLFTKDLAKEFNAVLMSDDMRQIKTQIDRLIEIVNHSQSRTASLFFNKKSISQLSDIIIKLEPNWLKKVNSALALGLEETHLKNIIAVKSTFQNYAAPQNRAQPIGHGLRTQL